MQFECRMAGCSTQQDRRRRMLGCRDVVWCEAARDLHEPQSGELHEWKWFHLDFDENDIFIRLESSIPALQDGYSISDERKL